MRSSRLRTVERYIKEILDRVDLAPIVAEMPADGVSALFCVERDPEACHRSLVAERIVAEYGLPLRAPSPPRAPSAGADPRGAGRLVV